MKSYLEEVCIYETMKKETHDFLLEKYKHEIQTQREMIGSIREEAFKPYDRFNPEKFEYLQKVCEDYTCKLWFLFNFDAEQYEIRKKNEIYRRKNS
jgi:hypothetical protein